MPRPSARSTSPSGFSLLETLFALALVAIALLFALALVAHQARLERHTTAHAEVLDILDTSHERLRAGWPLPLGTTAVDWQAAYEPGYRLQAAEKLSLALEVEPLPLAGLLQVTLRARYAVGPRAFERHVQTLAWRP